MIFGTPCAAWARGASFTRRLREAGGGDSDALQKFLKSLIRFPPDDTASNLDRGNRTTPGFPQFGHEHQGDRAV